LAERSFSVRLGEEDAGQRARRRIVHNGCTNHQADASLLAENVDRIST
jgi:hypothetical protein